jgi:hypothetical protein
MIVYMLTFHIISICLCISDIEDKCRYKALDREFNCGLLQTSKRGRLLAFLLLTCPFIYHT